MSGKLLAGSIFGLCNLIDYAIHAAEKGVPGFFSIRQVSVERYNFRGTTFEFINENGNMA
jgi:hypothetical protein